MGIHKQELNNLSLKYCGCIKGAPKQTKEKAYANISTTSWKNYKLLRVTVKVYEADFFQFFIYADQ